MITLASASPRRRQLLARLVPDFQVVPSGVDESLDHPVSPDAVAALAMRKARAVAPRVGGLVLAADTVVVVDGDPLGKPLDAGEARAMLRRLRGGSHVVITGLAMVDTGAHRAEATAVVSEVMMRDYADSVIEAYVASGEPLDKAGAYAIQGAGAGLVGGWIGSYSNIMGLPLEATAGLLGRFGVPLTSPGSGSPA
ncbi:MAG: Maf family protein [Candidatus Rokuibacteriota bacterium]